MLPRYHLNSPGVNPGALTTPAGSLYFRCRTGLRCNGLTRAGLLKEIEDFLVLRQSIRATFGNRSLWGLPACGRSFSVQPALCLLLPEEGGMVALFCDVFYFVRDYTIILNSDPKGFSIQR